MNQTIIRARREHSVSRDDIDPDALKVLYRLKQNGFTAYLVGGGVRDVLLGRRPKDFDISTDAHPRQLKKLFRNCFLIGRRFRLAHIRFGENIIETSTFRREPEPHEERLKEGALYRHRDNTFGTPEEDARRRDFTINGLFYDIKTFEVIDHVGGLKDLSARVVRCIGDPDVRFREDPVRMLRAIRFASRLSFTIERATYAAIKRHCAEITQAPPSRLLEEIRRLFAFRSGLPAFRMLYRTGLLSVLFPDIHACLRKRGASCRNRFWGHLGALDACGQNDDEPPTLQVIFATLTYPLFLECLREAERKGDGVHDAELAGQVLESLAAVLELPRKVLYSVVYILSDQRRFDESGRRFSESRFVQREEFPDVMLLRTIHLTATDGDVYSLDPWIRLYEENRGKARRDKPPAERRRRSRRRGRRS